MNALRLAGVALAFMSGHAFAQDTTVAVADLAKNPAAYAGQKVVVPDCLVLGFNTIVGAQCTTRPMDPSAIVYVDAASWAATTPDVLKPCDGMDIMKLCVLKVTGEVGQDGRGQALIKNATVEFVEFGPAM